MVQERHFLKHEKKTTNDVALVDYSLDGYVVMWVYLGYGPRHSDTTTGLAQWTIPHTLSRTRKTSSSRLLQSSEAQRSPLAYVLHTIQH